MHHHRPKLDIDLVIRQLPRVDTLEISYNHETFKSTDQILNLCNAIAQSRTLKTITLGTNIPPLVYPSFFNAIKLNNTLTSLDLDWSRTTPTSEQALADMLKHNSSLTHINFSSYRKHTMPVCLISSLVYALQMKQTLQSINLSTFDIYSNQAKWLAEALINNKSLTDLAVRFCNIDPIAAEQIAKALAGNTSLVNLNIALVNIADIEMGTIAKSFEATSLTNLTVELLRIERDGAKQIAKSLGANTSLTNLSIQHHGKIEEPLVTAFAQTIKNNTTLESFSINEGMLKEDALRMIKSLESNNSLTSLSLETSSETDDKIRNELAETLKVNTNLTSVYINSIHICLGSARIYPADKIIQTYFLRNHRIKQWTYFAPHILWLIKHPPHLPAELITLILVHVFKDDWPFNVNALECTIKRLITSARNNQRDQSQEPVSGNSQPSTPTEQRQAEPKVQSMQGMSPQRFFVNNIHAVQGMPPQRFFVNNTSAVQDMSPQRFLGNHTSAVQDRSPPRYFDDDTLEALGISPQNCVGNRQLEVLDRLLQVFVCDNSLDAKDMPPEDHCNENIFGVLDILPLGSVTNNNLAVQGLLEQGFFSNPPEAPGKRAHSQYDSEPPTKRPRNV